MIFVFFLYMTLDIKDWTLYDSLIMFRETDERFYFSFSVGLDVSKTFSPHYTDGGPCIIVSQ